MVLILFRLKIKRVVPDIYFLYYSLCSYTGPFLEYYDSLPFFIYRF